MPFSSPFPDIEIPKTDILSFLFPPDETPSEDPIWIDSKDTSISLSPAQLLQLVKRLALGLEKAGVRKGQVVMIHTPNHIFVPVAYLGIVGGGHAFSGANPIYTIPGEDVSLVNVASLTSIRDGTPTPEYRSSCTSHTSKPYQNRLSRR
jgi:4-coumarate--CoA ligase